MDDYLKQETERALARSRNILVAVAREADFDALAAGLALYLSLKKIGNKVSISGPGPKVSDAQSLYAVDKISALDDSRDLTITIDQAVDKVDKVTHSLDGKMLKLVIHALAGSAGVKKEDINFEYSNSKADLIFAIGFASQDQLKNEITHEQNINSDVWILSINKGTMNQKFAQVHLADPQASGISELTSSLIRTLNLPLDEDIAYNLYSGILHATSMFAPQFLKPATLEIARFLIETGAGRASLAGAQYTPKPIAGRLDQQPENTQQTPSANRSQPANFPKLLNRSADQKSVEQVEKEGNKESWLKPPKIYRGSKSFDSES